jgi:para-aminobenzoate synthetase/4-amino-4-deoxychorismate lyase
MGIGAGIVYDSDPEEEWRECLLKGRFLSNSVLKFELIETMLWLPAEGYVFLEEHLDRLVASAEYFLFPVDRDDIFRRFTAVRGQRTEDKNLEPVRVRLTLDRDGVVKITVSPLRVAVVDESTCEIAFSGHQVDPDDVFLYHKTSNRQLYNIERQKAEEQGLYEMLFTNTRGEVTEGTISTLFIEKKGKLYTPSLACGLLPGVYRQYMLESGQAAEQVLTVGDIRNADNLFMANSVRGMVQVFIR